MKITTLESSTEKQLLCIRVAGVKQRKGLVPSPTFEKINMKNDLIEVLFACRQNSYPIYDRFMHL